LRSRLTVACGWIQPDAATPLQREAESLVKILAKSVGTCVKGDA